MTYPPDDIVLLHLREGAFEFREQAFAWRFLRPSDTMLDVGATIAGCSLEVASNIIRDGRIVAIEPNTDISAFLQANLAEADVQIRSIAISDKDGKGTLHKGNAAETSLSSLLLCCRQLR